MTPNDDSAELSPWHCHCDVSRVYCTILYYYAYFAHTKDVSTVETVVKRTLITLSRRLKLLHTVPVVVHFPLINLYGRRIVKTRFVGWSSDFAVVSRGHQKRWYKKVESWNTDTAAAVVRRSAITARNYCTD